MKILATNDDGVNAIGLNMLANALKQLGDVTIIGPDRNCSGSSNALTLSRPLHATHLENGSIAIDGTPADCVHAAITGFMAEKPDLVVSGINAGSNLGDDVFYSGTVAAAIEGRFMGFQAIAFSLAGSELNHYATGAFVAKQIVTKLNADPLPHDTILNINIPDVAIDDLQGYEVTRLGTRHGAEPIIKRQDPRGKDIYWIGLPGPENDSGEGSDFHAIKNNKVSITPLQLDLTNYKTFDKISHWIRDFT